MNNIIIGFSRPKKWFEPFSWLIRLITRSKFSHAYVCFYSEEYFRWLIYQASGLEVNFIGRRMFNKLENTREEFSIPITEKTKIKMVQKAIDKCGLPYGIGQIFGFTYVLFMRFFGKRVKNPFYSKASYVCSELVSDILIEIDSRGSGNLNPSTMTPEDVYKYLIDKGYTPIKGN